MILHFCLQYVINFIVSVLFYENYNSVDKKQYFYFLANMIIEKICY